MIVVDASVALKWAVEEPGRAEALQVLALDQELIAPELIFAELANALRKKVKFGEVTSEQAVRAIHGVGTTLARVISAAELWPDALELARDLDHSAYDCFYLAAAIRGGMLVSADERFLRKCEQSGLALFVSSPAQLSDRSLNSEQEIELPVSLIEEVQRLASLVQTTFDTLGRSATAPSESGEFQAVPTMAYAPAFDCPAYRRLADLLKQLPNEQLAYLVALGWLGRSYHLAAEWPGLLANAKNMTIEGFNRHQRYFVAQMREVGPGLEKLRSAQSLVSPGRSEGL